MQTQIASPQEVRFTQTNEAFYVLFLEEPRIGEDGYVWVNATLPVLEGDLVSMMGSNGTGADLDWKTSEEGYLAIKAGADVLAAEEFCWVFKIAYIA